MSPIIRIVLRYILGMAVVYGWMPEGVADDIVNDPEFIRLIELAITIAAGAAVEYWWWLARKVRS